MPADYRFILVDATDGTNLGELPLTVTEQFTRVLNGCGRLAGTLPMFHPMTTIDMLQGGREITVLRDNVPVWNGPITMMDASWRDKSISVTAREPSWYFGKRTVEVDKTYTGADLFDIVRDLFDYIVNKTSTLGDEMPTVGTDINAALPRFTVDTGMAGQTRDASYSGAARHLFSVILEDLVADPATAFDYAIGYDVGSTRQQVQRTLRLGAPSLGVQREDPITLAVLEDFTKTFDRERAGNRAHTVGSGETWTLQNGSSVTTDGEVLLEVVGDRSDLTMSADIHSHTRALRRGAYPPVTSHTITWAPDSGPFPFDYCDLGDLIYIDVPGNTVLHSVGHRRVVEIGYLPPSAGSPELVSPVISLPIDVVT